MDKDDDDDKLFVVSFETITKPVLDVEVFIFGDKFMSGEANVLNY